MVHEVRRDGVLLWHKDGKRERLDDLSSASRKL